MNYRAEIDGLRAVAVLPVILFHAGVEFVSGGFVGVDVFFVISGYLITTIILTEMEQGTFSLSRFYERRARRILPALFLVCLVCMPFAWMLLSPQELTRFSQSLIGVVTFSSNILFWAESGYFESAAELKPLLHTWSLAVEEQYYLLFPLMLMGVWRFGKKVMVATLGVVFLFSLGVAQWSAYHKPEAAFYLLPTRGWELLVGGFCAFWLINNQRCYAPVARQFLSVLGLGLIGFSVFTFDASTPTPGFYTLLPVLGSALLILFANTGTLVNRLLSAPWLVATGTVSYSGYLWHQPIFAFLRHYTGNYSFGWVVIIVCIALTFALAFLSYRFVETPFRAHARYSRKKIVSGAFLVALILAVSGAAGIYYHGFENRFERQLAGEVGHVPFQSFVDSHHVDCYPEKVAAAALIWKGFLRCKQSKPGIPNIVLLGDSHAEHLFPGLADALQDLNVAFYIKAARPYSDNPEFAEIFQELLSNQSEQIIVLTMHYYARVSDNTDEFYQGFRATIQALLNAGKKVVLAGDVPEYEIEPDRCVFENLERRDETQSSLCDMNTQTANAQKNVYEPTLKRLSQEFALRFVDLYPAVCTEQGCSMASGNSILYRDEHHLNLPGSKMVGEYLAKRLQEIQ